VVGAAVDGETVVGDPWAAWELGVPSQAANASTAASANATTASPPRARCANLSTSHLLHRFPPAIHEP